MLNILLHGQIAAEIINTYYREIGTTLFEDKARYEVVRQAIHHAYATECDMIDAAIPGDSLNGTEKHKFKMFSKYRLNVYAERLGLPHEFVIDEDDTEVIDWFEKNTYAYKVVDFFSTGMGMEYETSWNREGFKKAWLEE